MTYIWMLPDQIHVRQIKPEQIEDMFPQQQQTAIQHQYSQSKTQQEVSRKPLHLVKRLVTLIIRLESY